MPPWLPAAAYVAGTLALFALRAPHIHRSAQAKVAESRIGPREKVLVTLVALGLLVVPILWLTTDLWDFAERAASWASLVAGLVAYGLGLWLLVRTHVDLGKNWSNTLQIKEGHTLITDGIYRRVRHPMYSALLLHTLGQALVIPNWVAGPAYLVAFALLVALRLGPEERMLLDRFGPAYAGYREQTKRLVPGLW